MFHMALFVNSFALVLFVLIEDFVLIMSFICLEF